MWDLVNPFPHTDAFWRPCGRLLKTLWQKKKLLMTSNFSFFHNVFNSIFNNITLIFENCSRFCQFVFKVVCYRFVVSGTWFKMILWFIENKYQAFILKCKYNMLSSCILRPHCWCNGRASASGAGGRQFDPGRLKPREICSLHYQNFLWEC